eukprot:6329319-Alexandrium_andersonii.AAC.1
MPNTANVFAENKGHAPSTHKPVGADKLGPCPSYDAIQAVDGSSNAALNMEYNTPAVVRVFLQPLAGEEREEGVCEES